MLDRLSRDIEALLFATDRPLSIDELCELTGSGEDSVSQAIERLKAALEESGHSLVIAEIAGGFRLMTDATHGETVAQLFEDRRPGRLTRAAIETLAVVAYNQPCTRAAVEAVRGVNCDSALKSLLERNLIRICGRQETVGRPLTYATTEDFLSYFGLSDIDHLPRRREIEEILSTGMPAGQDSDLFEENRG
ncbi:SMC-Scp complex subunit ScpB [Candidatus Fermentibacteria bacterium]|nr:SMC-Scp complex subunit ScpB [Candidatus Fermentibacteria bacterium]